METKQKIYLGRPSRVTSATRWKPTYILLTKESLTFYKKAQNPLAKRVVPLEEIESVVYEGEKGGKYALVLSATERRIILGFRDEASARAWETLLSTYQYQQ